MNEPNGSVINNVSHSIKDSKPFDYKVSITKKLEGTDTTKNVKIVVPFKYLSIFWRTLDIPFISCEVSLTLIWPANCAITDKVYREANTDANPGVVAINNPTDATFKITGTKLFVPVVTLFIRLWTFFKALQTNCNRHKSSCCDYPDACILVTRHITAKGGDKNCAPLTWCVNGEHIDAAENLNLEILIYNLIEYSDNYSDTPGRLWQFKRDESRINDFGNPDNISTNNSSLYKYKSSIVNK